MAVKLIDELQKEIKAAGEAVTIWSQPTGREALSKDPVHKWKAEI